MAPSGQTRSSRRRRLGGWGFEGESYLPSGPMLAWLEQRLGRAPGPFPAFDVSRLAVPASRPLPDLGRDVSREPLDRLIHARGQGLTDLLRLRGGAVPAFPDAVIRPAGADEVEDILQRCAAAGVCVIPWGGGTSVTGGVNVIPDGKPTVAVDLERVTGLTDLDQTSGLATFGAGTTGPAIEAALAEHGFTLGHFPQSWELSTLGGWAATRASGQESLGYGDIQDIVAGLELVAPHGRLALPAYPASAAGPDLRQLVVGSEGRLGIITRATVRVRRRPPLVQIAALLLPTWHNGLEGARALLQDDVPLSLLRLSDEPETEVAMAVGLSGHRWAAHLAQGWLRLQGIRRFGCLMLCGAAGEEVQVRATLERARSVLRRHGGVGLGLRPGQRWLQDRFRHPYLRDALLDIGTATDTLETAAPWSKLPALADAVRQALSSALAGEDEAAAVLCHVSHPYRDGASLYFTFFFRCPGDADLAIARWARLKRAATQAIVDRGATLSHHHGIGSWHAPWFEREAGAGGVELIRSAAAALDPTGVLNPHALLDPIDRLEI